MDNTGVHIFWDFESLPVKRPLQGYKAARAICDIASRYGQIKSIRAYMDCSDRIHPKFTNIRRELHSSGISLIDCPSQSQKDVADKTIIVDMFTLVLDNPPPQTIVVVTSDIDLSYALAILRLRRYRIIVICPYDTESSLAMQANDTFNWKESVLGSEDDDDETSSSASTASISSAVPSQAFSSSSRTDSRPPSPTSCKSRENVAEIEAERPHTLGSAHDRPSEMNSGNRRNEPTDENSSPPEPAIVPASPAPRFRASTILGGVFFPPPPAFPLERPNGTASQDNRAKGSSASSPLREDNGSPATSAEFVLVNPPAANIGGLDDDHTEVVVEPISNMEIAIPVNPTPPPPPKSGSSPLTNQASIGGMQRNYTTESIIKPPSTATITNPPLKTISHANELSQNRVSTQATTSFTHNHPNPTPSPKNPTSRVLPEKHRLLVRRMQYYIEIGNPRPSSSLIASDIVRQAPSFYQKVGVPRWGVYVAQAREEGIITSINNNNNLVLNPEWVNYTI